jgi:hypothetical protein
MAKSFEQRIAYLEKVIVDFFKGAPSKAKKSSSSLKRKTKAAQKPITRKVSSRKTSSRKRRAQT